MKGTLNSFNSFCSKQRDEKMNNAQKKHLQHYFSPIAAEKLLILFIFTSIYHFRLSLNLNMNNKPTVSLSHCSSLESFSIIFSSINAIKSKTSANNFKHLKFIIAERTWAKSTLKQKQKKYFSPNEGKVHNNVEEN